MKVLNRLIIVLLLAGATLQAAPRETVRLLLPPQQDSPMTLHEAFLLLGLPRGFEVMVNLEEQAARAVIELAETHRKQLIDTLARELDGDAGKTFRALRDNGLKLGPDLSLLPLTDKQREAVLQLDARRREAHEAERKEGRTQRYYRIEYDFTRGVLELLTPEQSARLDKVLEARRAPGFPKDMIDNPTRGKRVMADPEKQKNKRNGLLPHIVAVDGKTRQVTVAVPPPGLHRVLLDKGALLVAEGKVVAPEDMAAGRPVHLVGGSVVRQSAWLVLQARPDATVQVLSGRLDQVNGGTMRLAEWPTALAVDKSTRWIGQDNTPIAPDALPRQSHVNVVLVVEGDKRLAAVVRAGDADAPAVVHETGLLQEVGPSTVSISSEPAGRRTFKVAPDFRLHNYSKLLDGKRRVSFEDLEKLVGTDVPLVGYWSEPTGDETLPTLRFGYLTAARRDIRQPNKGGQR